MRDIYGRTVQSAYDYVVVGSGSAGSVIAARLAEDKDVKVLLLEAGPVDDSLYIRMPAALGFPLTDDRFNWYMHSEEEPELNNRKIYEARGRVLGGSSSINGMNWVRGNPWDYDNWEALGAKGWSYKDCLPYFKKAESFDKGGNEYRGDSGPMKIETCKANNPLYQAFLEAGVQAGYERVDDHNGYKQEGVHITQRNIHKGLRWNTSRAYIHENKDISRLHVCDKSQVTRIEFDKKKAVRIHFHWHGMPQVIEIKREIILSAGALHTPHILMLSGIGDKAHLKEHGIECVADLPGVGQGLKDHVAA
ncbi:GMC family oxidoreductase N-terminal domain-containing protein, partial [Acinetobacter baumannii]